MPLEDEEFAADQAEVEATMNYDPFEEGGAFGPDSDGSAAEVSEPAPDPTPAPAPAPAAKPAPEPRAASTATPAAPAPSVAPKSDPSHDALVRTNETLRQVLERQIKPPQPGPEVRPEDIVPPYVFNVREEIVNAIASGEPAQIREAINAIAAGVAHVAHKTVRDEYRQYMGTAIQDYVRSHVEKTSRQKEVAQDFYSKYPSLNNEYLRPLVAAVATRVSKGSHNLEDWTPQMRDMIGTEVMKVLSGAAPAGQPQSGQPVAVAAPVAQVQQSGNGSGNTRRVGGPTQMVPRSRPPEVRVADSVAEISDTLFGRD